MQPLDEGLVVVVGDVGVDQKGVGFELAFPHGVHEPLALELLRLQESARKEDQQRVGSDVVFRELQVRFHVASIGRPPLAAIAFRRFRALVKKKALKKSSQNVTNFALIVSYKLDC